MVKRDTKIQQTQKIQQYVFSFVTPCLMAVPFFGLLECFERYVFADWEFLRFLLVFMTLDTVVSWWFHIKARDFSSKGFSMLFVKIIIYSVLLIIAHGFASCTIGGEPVEPLKWFRPFICTALLIRESISIVENLNKIMPGIIPTTITKYLNDFDEKGQFRKDTEL